MNDMQNHSNDDTTKDWGREFANNALERAAQELRGFKIHDNHSPLASQRKMAEAAVAIGWMVVNEVGGLLGQGTIEKSRDEIITGLSDILQNSYPDETHLGHDIVDALVNAVGEVPDRTESIYD